MQTYKQILDDLKAKRFKPVYLLMGEESYYIDRLADYIQNNVLDDVDKDFNLSVLYGDKLDDYVPVAETAMRPPMMSDRQVVVVREAQMIGSRNSRKKDLIDILFNYVKNPLASTILVICYKEGKLDKRKKVVAEIAKSGILYESEALRDYQVATWIKNYLAEQHLTADDKAVNMLAEHLGTNLSRIVTELDKLTITMSKGTNRITPEAIEKNIGFSKEYNNFELLNAILSRDVEKATRIGLYFGRNQKTNNIIPTISILFSLFSDLLLANYTQDKGDASLARRLGKAPFIAKQYGRGVKIYGAWKCMQNIAILREYDAKSKGIGSNTESSELLKELIFKLMH